MPVRRLATAASTVLLVAGLAATPSTAEPMPADQRRQQAFAAAAAEFGVPERVLLGVSYLESRWDHNGGTPSTGAGYGPMHLTDLRAAGGGTHHDEGGEDPRGDSARPPLLPQAPAAPKPQPALQTVDLAAELTGTDPATLRTDPGQNIRGGAALLAHYQHALGHGTGSPADWYGAVARYGGATESTAAAAFADEVFSVIANGQHRRTDDGQRVRLAGDPGIVPARAQLAELDLRNPDQSEVECPREISCEWIPAPYQELPGDDYGNHDKANRPEDQQIEYIVIHDTEGYWDTALRLVQDPTYVSWHYTLRSADGHIAQHVPTRDVGWHAGNWYVNAKSIGLEHEGFAAQGTWYTEAMYRSSAKLVRHLAERYDIPLDRAHIIGHDNVPGTVPDRVAQMHWDPGPYWDWAHYFDLMGAPFEGGQVRPGSHLLEIAPEFTANRPEFLGCDRDNPTAPCPSRGSASVVLRTEPRPDASLLTDVGLHPDGSPATMRVSDIGSRTETGQRYAVAEVRGGWTAVWYLGQKGWFHNPPEAPAAHAVRGSMAVAKPGLGPIPVYGRAYPEAGAYPDGKTPQRIVPLQYELPPGQRYSVGWGGRSEYYSATTFDPAEHVVVRGDTRYVQIQFGHRFAYVKAKDVLILPATR
ncbi:N-acetylmuramoyl-L-alanine amidase [Amycolatopsis cihanbeyliensis]|uniref:N-acetylmuramoyl-L-alanine amidase n=1 Tax=Amycolatopsis cihanbeyliensis TaxID=1128664 RepID=A0A542DJ38_AMYCI|nr:peptidoglycan recognition family protein [Amycolatopsis cihanbeyliensis]TQJ03112.1 N-acetyl-anhydromuramyl-L-alanine amidase AmpD [Amycolatopsis cihanbeyliensis]